MSSNSHFFDPHNNVTILRKADNHLLKHSRTLSQLYQQHPELKMTITLPGIATNSQEATEFNDRFDKLAPELKVAIIAQAVKGDAPIDLKYFNKEVDKLLAPFTGNDLVIAQEEVLRSNVFTLDLDVTRKAFLTDEYTSWYLPAPRFPDEAKPKGESKGVGIEGAERERLRLFFFPRFRHLDPGVFPSSQLPYRLSEEWMSLDAQNIRHLVVDSPDSLCGSTSHLDHSYARDVLERIPHIFPKLKSLEVHASFWPPPWLSKQGPWADRVKKLGEVIEVVKKMKLPKRNLTKKVVVRHNGGRNGSLSLDFELKDKHAKVEEDKVYNVNELVQFSPVEIG